MRQMQQWLTAKRWRIILAGVLLTVTPPVLLAGFVASEMQQHFTEQVMADNLQTARLVASRIEERLANDTNFARAFAARPYLLEGLQRGDKREMDKHLQNLIETSISMERAFITSPAGIQLAAYPEDSATLGKDFSHRDWYQGVAKDWQPYVSEFYLRAARPQRYLFAMAVPVKAKDGTVYGILVLQPNANYLQGMTPHAPDDGQTSRSHVYVVDGKGRAIYHPEMQPEALVDFSDRPGVQGLLRGEEGTGTFFCPLHRETEIIAYVPIRQVGWGVVIYNPQHAALAPLRHIVYGILGLAGFMVLLGGLLAYKGADLLAGTARLNRELAKKEAAEKAYSEFLTMLNLPWSTLEELGEASLRKLCAETCAETGVFYLIQDGGPAPYAAFGVAKPMQPDGLAQACLAQGKTISLAEIPPESHLTLHTGAGAFIPKEILAVPLQYQDETIGVIELACIHGLSELDREIVQRITPQLGIAINTIKNTLARQQLAEKLGLANEELQAMNADFQAMNEELQAQQQVLSHTNRRLEEVSRAKSDFLANMSHELRTPLTSIIGFSEVLQDTMFGPLSDKQQEYVGHILASGQHLLALINDILDLSKVEADKMELELGRFPLKEMLEASLTIVRKKAMKHGIKLRLDLTPEADCEISADQRKLKQILYNLLSNAVKFTPDGGAVTVAARSLPPAGEAGGFLEISVQDTGVGIREEDMGRLFQAFSQLESPYDKKHEGTGLGLALTRRLVLLHGGAIRVESRLGEGSRFIFTLPKNAAPTQPQAPPPVAPVSPVLPTNTHVLLIEDDLLARAAMEHALTTRGYRITAASGGLEGIAVALADHPGLIILDLLLPDLAGFEVVARLRVEELTRNVPIIVLTAMALSPSERERLGGKVWRIVEKGNLSTQAFAELVASAIASPAR